MIHDTLPTILIISRYSDDQYIARQSSNDTSQYLSVSEEYKTPLKRQSARITLHLFICRTVASVTQIWNELRWTMYKKCTVLVYCLFNMNTDHDLSMFTVPSFQCATRFNNDRMDMWCQHIDNRMSRERMCHDMLPYLYFVPPLGKVKTSG